MVNLINDKVAARLSEQSTNSKVEQLTNEINKFSSFNSQVVIFGEIAKLINFNGKNVHIEFWLEPSQGWLSNDGDDKSLCGLTHRCYSTTAITSIGAPFQFIVSHNETKSTNEFVVIKGFTLYFRVVEHHRFGRSSTEAFGILPFPCRPGRYARTIKMFRPYSNRIIDKLMENFLGYSFDLDDLEEHHYEPLGLIYTESKGSISVNFNVILQSSSYGPKFDESDDNFDPLWSDISQIVAAFRRARQRMIFLRMKACRLFKKQKSK